jgi:pentatricopeptide repeat protein
MDTKGISWKHEIAVYDYLLYSLSHMSGNEAHADKIIDQMLANDLVPREETVKAAILCAARSGDLEACSRYISRMHEEWDLGIGERMKAILLYACAKRGDFDSAVDILGQLSVTGTLVRSKAESRIKKRATGDNSSLTSSTTTNAYLEEILSSQDIINNTNVLLALINQTHNKRGNKKQMTQEFIKEEVSKVLELFTVITKNPQQIDTQLYTIMMQYLSTLPSPLPGMTYLYKEMQGTKCAKPNHVTYKIMLEACAEQMDMEYGKQLWDDMDASKVIKDCYVRASFVKGWGKIGYLKQAEWIAREGYLIQQGLDKDRRQHRMALALKNRKRRDQGLPELPEPPRPPRRQRLNDIISLNVVHELMRANRAHNKPDRVYEIYQEIEHGKWGSRMRPNQFTLSIVLQACGSGTATSKLVDQGIDLVERYLESQHRQLQQFKGEDDDDQDEDSGSTKAATEAEETISGKTLLASLSDINYQLYFTMLGRHHRQRKMVTVWDDMMRVIERPPSHGTTNMVMEALENVQWGATPIKRIQRQLRERWPQVNWDGAGKKKRIPGVGSMGELVDEDRSVGAGGRFWR